jgi:2Fe-2S ferredoxin
MMSPIVIVTTREGVVRRLDGVEGASVMAVLRDAEVDDEIGLCGGCCSCATCHVYVEDADSHALPAMSGEEHDMLDSLDTRTDRSRLGCQLRLGDGLTEITVTLPPSGY